MKHGPDFTVPHTISQLKKKKPSPARLPSAAKPRPELPGRVLQPCQCGTAPCTPGEGSQGVSPGHWLQQCPAKPPSPGTRGEAKAGAWRSSERIWWWGRRGGGCGVAGGEGTPAAGSGLCEEGGLAQWVEFHQAMKSYLDKDQKPALSRAGTGDEWVPWELCQPPGTPSRAHRMLPTPAHAPCTCAPVPDLDSASHIPRLPAKATSAFLWQPSSLQPCAGTKLAMQGSLEAGEGKRGRFWGTTRWPETPRTHGCGGDGDSVLLAHV